MGITQVRQFSVSANSEFDTRVNPFVSSLITVSRTNGEGAVISILAQADNSSILSSYMPLLSEKPAQGKIMVVS